MGHLFFKMVNNLDGMDSIDSIYFVKSFLMVSVNLSTTNSEDQRAGRNRPRDLYR
jgi:hypothetical protein